MIKVVSVEQMRAIERATDASGVSYAQMMEHAGRATADVVIELLGEPTAGKRVAFLIGPGNNGGDGLVAARLLKMETEAEIGCYLFKQRSEDDPVYTAARDAGVFIAVAENDQRWRVLKNLVGNATILVDALLGTGAKLPVEGNLKKLLESAKSALQHSKQPAARLIRPASPDIIEQPHTLIVAVDCPSGLDCDTGALDPAAIPADITVTFAAAKHGQLRFPGAEAVGELVVADISVPPDLPELTAVATELATGEDVKGLLPARPLNGHKGTFGRAVIVAGSVNYTGAAVLAGGAAYRVGAGLVTMAVPQLIHPILAAQLAEATWLLLPHEMGVINTAALEVFLEEVGEAQAILIGPGLGQDNETAGFIRGLLRGDHQAKKGSISFVARKEGEAPQNMPRHAQLPPLVIDADGLNLLTRVENWWTLLPPGTVLTPHPGEMARLTGLERDTIQADRFGIAASKASEWGCVVVLKGAFTVVAGPDGRATAIPFATDALSTAGTGDVLSGCIVGLMAQGIAPFEAAVAGAYLHGLAGILAGQAMSTRAVMAGDVMRALPEALQIINAT